MNLNIFFSCFPFIRRQWHLKFMDIFSLRAWIHRNGMCLMSAWTRRSDHHHHHHRHHNFINEWLCTPRSKWAGRWKRRWQSHRERVCNLFYDVPYGNRYEYHLPTFCDRLQLSEDPQACIITIRWKVFMTQQQWQQCANRHTHTPHTCWNKSKFFEAKEKINDDLAVDARARPHAYLFNEYVAHCVTKLT